MEKSILSWSLSILSLGISGFLLANVNTAPPESAPMPAPIQTQVAIPSMEEVHKQAEEIVKTKKVNYQPTALCVDGTYSYSQHRQGTCSHHGGVAYWF